MKNTFYRPKEIDTGEFSKIVHKMRSDLLELISGKVPATDVTEYAKKLIADALPLTLNPEMMFWGLADPDQMPSDARVDFLYTPTYIAVSFLVYLMLKNPEFAISIGGLEATLKKGLAASTGRGFEGHGYEAYEGFLNCIALFSEVRIIDFIKKYPDFCPVFTEQIETAITALENGVSSGKILGMWGEDYTEQAKSVLSKLQATGQEKKVFVYGTLLRGNGNHEHFLGQSRFLGKAVLQGYALYNLGSYPGIIENTGDLVKGELYEIDEPTLKRLNYLEGEGSLYALKSSPVEFEDGTKVEAGIYVYLHAVNPAKKVNIDKQPWRS